MSKSLTAVVLTKNEAKNIRACLENLNWVNDLIVVDSGSKDSTLDISAEFGARIFVNIPGKFYIADQRNWALDNAGIQTDWVLFIDADEIVTKPLKEEILKRISDAPTSVTGFQLCFKFMFMGRWLKHTCGFPSWHDRLVRFGTVRFKGKVWEEIETDGKVEWINEPYLHYGFNNGINAWIDRHQRYAEWKAQQLLETQNGDATSLIKKLFTLSYRERKRYIEKVAGQFLFISPMLRFLYYYVIRLGFLDGKAGLVYSRMMAMYQFMIYLHFLEKKRQKENSLF